MKKLRFKRLGKEFLMRLILKIYLIPKAFIWNVSTPETLIDSKSKDEKK